MQLDQNYFLIIGVIAAWDVAWKAIGMWKAARNGQKYWFVALIILNTLGILPIVYLKFFQKKRD